MNHRMHKARSDINKVILILSDAKQGSNSRKIVELSHLISELASVRDRISKILEETKDV